MAVRDDAPVLITGRHEHVRFIASWIHVHSRQRRGKLGVITAIERDPLASVRAGRLLENLLYRLNVIRITLQSK